MSSTSKKSDTIRIPEHLAIIMDGNGRWAQKRGLPRTMGHKKGAESAKELIENAAKAGIKYVTLFGFSSENWNRPKEEIKDLMGLLRQYLRSQTANLHQNNVKLSVIGERQAFDKDIIELIENAESLTQNNDKIHVIIALNYGGRQDIAQAAQKVIEQSLQEGTAPNPENIENLLEKNLYTSNIPDPDLLIRTSGELRISNFLLWQCAYSEMIFTNTLWPDFSEEDLNQAIAEYTSRDRRFGGIKVPKKG